MDETTKKTIGDALAKIPSGLFILTAQHEDRRMGMLTSWVQQACFEPPMISVAVAKGRAIMPLISDSRQFALCQLAESDKLIIRKFTNGLHPGEDPFLGFDLIPGRLNKLPILAQTMCYLECELACHMDVEGDHDIFIGQIRGGACNNDHAKPAIHLRTHGYDY